MQKTEKISNYINTDSEILGGTAVFSGTRIPISILFDYLKGGDTLQDFIENYPSINIASAKRVIEFSAENLLKMNAKNEAAA